MVLKRLSAAQRDGDRILAMVRGTAMNQDGRSNGLTAPNGPAQESVIRQAIAQAGIEPCSVGYVEAHGTGTPLGDPIEIQALAAALGQGRAPDHPLLVGSVKTNIGHTEGAAGIAGLIKSILALQNQTIPASLHYAEPNPYIPWDELPIQVVTENRPWIRNGTARRAGISSFGMSGTNAHVVLEEAPVAQQCASIAERPVHIALVSSRSQGGLLTQAEKLANYVSTHSDQQLGDICHTLSLGRTHFEHRAAIAVRTSDDLSQQLRALSRDEDSIGVARGSVVPGSDRPRVAFLFTG
ncbi:MAG: ketoacyl-synthetase C-terminal extension domain-containing protein, partial [Myxococcota bacterium]